MASMAFKPMTEWTPASGAVTWLPRAPTLGNFQYTFTGTTADYPSSTAMERTAWRPILASLLVSGVGTLIATIAGTLAAYGFSRFNRGRDLPLILAQQRLFPPLAVIIPVMIMWAYLDLIDRWWGLALIYGLG